MCRILLVASKSESLNLVTDLMKLFVEASVSDELLRLVAGDARHCHGYGIFAAIRRGPSWHLIYERFDGYPHPEGDEASCRLNLGELSKAVSRLSRLASESLGLLALLHSRRTLNEPRGTLQTHPYSYTIIARGGPREVYVAHNGVIDKEPLAAVVGVDPTAYSDSYVLAVWLARQLSYGRTLPEALAELAQYVRTALNLGVVIVRGDGLEAYGVGYVREGLEERVRKYYELFCFEGEGVAGVASSTVKELAETRKLNLKFSSCDGLVTRINVERPGIEVVAKLK